MVVFLDKFDRLDTVDLAGGQPTYGWLPLHAGVYGVELHGKVMTNEGGTRALAMQLLTNPTKANVELEATTWHNVEAADARIFLGTYGDASALNVATLLWGFGVSLLFAAGGVRTLEIWQDKEVGIGVPDPGLTSPEVKASVSVADKTIKEAGTDLGVMQSLRFILNQETQGTRIRAYLNQTDDAKPTLQAILQRDVVPGPSNSFFHWSFAFGDVVADRTLALMSFSARDVDFKKATDFVGRDVLLLGDIIDRAKLRYEGSSSQSDFDEELAIVYANDAQNEIINELGDLATFLQPRELITLSVDETSGLFSLPGYVENILMVVTDETYEPIVWRKVSDGQYALSPGYTGPFWVTYQIRKQRMNARTDASVIPQNYCEALVLGVVYRMCMDDTSSGAYAQRKTEFAEKLFQMKSKLNKLARATKPRLRSVMPTRAVVSPGRLDFWNRGGY